MADEIQIPNSLVKNPELIKTFRDEFNTLFDENSRPFKGKEEESEKFLKRIKDAGISYSSVKNLGVNLERWYELTVQEEKPPQKEVEEEPEKKGESIPSNTPSPDHPRKSQDKVTADVPVEAIGESPAELAGTGTVVQYLYEIELEALPEDVPEKFVVYKSRLTKVGQSIKISDLKIDRDKLDIKNNANAIIVRVESPEKDQEKKKNTSPNTLTPDQLKELQERDEKLRAQRKAVIESSDKEIRAAIERQKQIYKERIEAAQKKEEEFKDKKTWAKVKDVELEGEQKTQFESLKEKARVDAAGAVEDVTEEIKERLGDYIPEGAAELTAFNIVANLQTNYKPAIKAAVTHKVTEEARAKGEDIVSWIDPLTEQSKNMQELTREITKLTFGENFQKKAIPSESEIELSDIPQPGYTPVSHDYIIPEAVEVAKIQTETLENPSLKETDYANKWVGSQLSRLESGGAVKRKILLTSFKQGEATSKQETAPPEKMKTAVAVGESLNTIDNLAKGLGKKAISKGIAKVVSKLALKGNPFGWIASILGKEAINKFIDSIDFKTVKKYSAIIIGLLMGAVAGIGFGIGYGLGIGFASFGVSAAFGAGTGGLTLSGIGSWIVSTAAIIGTATLGAIAIPILVTLLVFPVVVALILFIINSGAYVVPLAPPDNSFVGSGIQVICTTEKGPVGVSGPSSSSSTANRAWEITSDLYQGFWCFWNRSPKAPEKYFPDDVLTYPPGYPELFDYELFLTNPNPPESIGPNLFWCTYLVVKAYQETGVNVPFELNSQSMFNAWPRRTIPAAQASPSNIVPGSVIFFHVTTGPNRLNHVAIVYSVDAGGITIVESNAPLKSQTINFKPGGGVGNLPLMEVKYFGLP